MSEYVVHFTKAHSETPAFHVLARILGSGRLEARSRFGAAKKLEKLGDSQLAVCFSEIPMDLLERLVRRRSPYGLGFRKDFLAQEGGARVWYLDKDGPVLNAYYELETSKIRSSPDDSFWRLTPFIDSIGRQHGWRYEFEWEREWRVAGPGGLRFDPADVAFLFMPETDHPQARAWFGLTYPGPYIDPRWPMERIQEAAAGIVP